MSAQIFIRQLKDYLKIIVWSIMQKFNLLLIVILAFLICTSIIQAL